MTHRRRTKPVIRILLQILLFPLLVMAVFFAHGYIAVILTDLSGLFQTHQLQLAALLASSLIAAALVATVFAYPLVLLCPSRVAWAAIVVCLPTALFRAPYVLGSSGKPFVVAALLLEMIALMVLVPYGAWLLNRLRANR